jgi:hypothetical protein
MTDEAHPYQGLFPLSLSPFVEYIDVCVYVRVRVCMCVPLVL